MQVIEETTAKGVTERTFALHRPEEQVPGILWTPEGASGPRPLVAFGHGGTQNKRAPNIVSMARRLVRHHGYAAVAIDLPFHGDRQPAEVRDLSQPQRMRQLLRWMFGRGHHETVEQGLDDWTATLDPVRALDEVGDGPLGYWGLSMGTHFGVPLVARDPRIEAAVLGLFGWTQESGLAGYDAAARQITVPLLFLVQWDDELVDRDQAFELFGLLGSTEKSLHANPGVHIEVPVAERDAAEQLFVRHLGEAEPAASASAA